MKRRSFMKLLAGLPFFSFTPSEPAYPPRTATSETISYPSSEKWESYSCEMWTYDERQTLTEHELFEARDRLLRGG